MAVEYARQETSMKQAASLPLVSAEETFWIRPELFSQEVPLVLTSKVAYFPCSYLSRKQKASEKPVIRVHVSIFPFI
jgi:hypothetical protein